MQEHGLFNDSSKYDNVEISALRANDKDGYILVEFNLCLVVIKNNAGFIEDVIKMWKKFGNENVTGHRFNTGECIFFVVMAHLPTLYRTAFLLTRKAIRYGMNGNGHQGVHKHQTSYSGSCWLRGLGALSQLSLFLTK